ncbi:hypothetical protein CMESO_297 (nucleomorph) [Chroomonas mesostigmatica CCMP1168]|uniref:Uncharacterized protein n=1 Tax=Chroomonas mesostigmatica CCMP1168 TaxID=1195612 RepID=J7G1W4_9CRYP|nr:hypothetical protein CMESO_297 [Chroomonas mesostigmatica CCMP1168]
MKKLNIEKTAIVSFCRVLMILKKWSFPKNFRKYNFFFDKKKIKKKNASINKKSHIIIILRNDFFFLRKFKISFDFYKFYHSYIFNRSLYDNFFFFSVKIYFLLKLKNLKEVISVTIFNSKLNNYGTEIWGKKSYNGNLLSDSFNSLLNTYVILSIKKKEYKKKKTTLPIFFIKNLFYTRIKFLPEKKSKKLKKPHKNFFLKTFVKIISVFFFLNFIKKAINKKKFKQFFHRFHVKKIQRFLQKFVGIKKYFYLFLAFFFYFFLNSKIYLLCSELFLIRNIFGVLKITLAFKTKKWPKYGMICNSIIF